ncbi:ABC transporter permease [Bifidobacterium samirii]|uniref:Peptide ABC transporter permease n=1 Tax=Bifidobacterium samirii TaxID=2306974 RepID=A0A430FW09_9BIFI|nr:ABC transporter permease [Bifidobacterium samirii]RSX58133.1 peptide ABC transporter permease [Bifidobacterium samirii]
MRFPDILHLSGQNLLRRKSRTALTVLGVIVGCCSIVLMVSIGAGLNEQNERFLKQMGDLSIITVYPGNGGMTGGTGTSGGSGSGGESTKLDDKAVSTMRSIADVAGVTPLMEYQYTADMTAVSGRYVSKYVSIMGIDTSQLDEMGYTMLDDGRLPTKKGEVLLGEYTAYGFMDKYRPDGSNTRTPAAWGGGYVCDANGNCQEQEAEDEDPFFNPLTTELTLITGAEYNGSDSPSDQQGDVQTLTLRAVGLLKEDFNKGYATNDGVIMDLTQLKELIAKVDPTSAKKDTEYQQVLVKAGDIKAVSDVEEQIKAMGFNTSSYEQMRESLAEQSRGLQLALGGIGGVAFLVAAIGIANTMIMSVSERTREIGIMKALGCYVRDIRMMFLGEAAAIGLFGGLIGCLISGLGSWLINVFSMGGFTGDNWLKAITGGDDVTRISVIPWWLFLSGVLLSTAVGLIAGFGPANKAVRIPALDAIKNNQ